MTIESFDAVSYAEPKVLILGSIPGTASLKVEQYYGHPRNAFWPIVGRFFNFDEKSNYSTRLEALLSCRAALWDVLKRCEREGSLDSAIQKDTIEQNAIDRWLLSHATVSLILLNGGTAGREFKRHFPQLWSNDSLSVKVMPSTSPAYAAMSFAEKERIWHEALSQIV